MFKPMAPTTTTGGPMATTTTTGGEATHAHVQSLPCNIKYDGPADVSGRLIVKQHADGGLETAFRGRELRGVDAPLRRGTTGLVVHTGDGTARVTARVIGPSLPPPSFLLPLGAPRSSAPKRASNSANGRRDGKPWRRMRTMSRMPLYCSCLRTLGCSYPNAAKPSLGLMQRA